MLIFEDCRYIRVYKFAVEVTMQDEAPLILEVDNPYSEKNVRGLRSIFQQ